MSYVDRCLIAGESVLYKARLHWIVLFGHALAGTLIELAGVACLIRAATTATQEKGTFGVIGVLGFVLLVVGAGITTLGVVKRNATEIAVTNKRVLIKTGIINRITVELLLSKIESIGVHETLMGRMLGFGTVIVRGTGGTPEQFDKIGNPLEFRRQVQSQIEGAAVPARSTA